jgi:enterochelin esterase-like enzyme
MAFQIYLPPCYGQDGRVYPTIYLLHGNGQSEALWDRLGVDEVGNAGILQQTLPPFIMVMPRGGWAHTNSSGGVGSYEDVIMNELIPHIENNFCAWDTRYGRAIGGISRGGYWALEVAFRNPMAFASVGGHSAALLDLVAGPNLNPQYTGIDNNLGDLRVYLDVGEIDWGSRTNLERLHEDMGNAGISHQWLLNEGGHNEPYWTAHVPEYLTWYTEIWSKNRASYPVCE